MVKTAKALPLLEDKRGLALLEVAMGNVLSAASFGLFILPSGFASAGVTGFSSVLCKLLPLSLTQFVFIVNVLFLILAFAFVGKEFAVKTIISSITFPLLLQCFSLLNFCPTSSSFINALLAGVLLGTGSGLLLKSGSSSGGFAVLAVLLENKCRIPVSLTLAITDATVILLQAHDQPLLASIYGVLVVLISAFVVNKIKNRDSSSSKGR